MKPLLELAAPATADPGDPEDRGVLATCELLHMTVTGHREGPLREAEAAADWLRMRLDWWKPTAPWSQAPRAQAGLVTGRRRQHQPPTGLPHRSNVVLRRHRGDAARRLSGRRHDAPTGDRPRSPVDEAGGRLAVLPQAADQGFHLAPDAIVDLARYRLLQDRHELSPR